MIREFALSLSNRHHFHESNKMSKLEGTPQDTFMSLWEYDEYVIEYVKKKQLKIVHIKDLLEHLDWNIEIKK